MPCIQRLASGLMYKASEALLGLRICGLLTKRLINGYGSLDIDHVFSICVCVCVCVFMNRDGVEVHTVLTLGKRTRPIIKPF